MTCFMNNIALARFSAESYPVARLRRNTGRGNSFCALMGILQVDASKVIGSACWILQNKIGGGSTAQLLSGPVNGLSESLVYAAINFSSEAVSVDNLLDIKCKNAYYGF